MSKVRYKQQNRVNEFQKSAITNHKQVGVYQKYAKINQNRVNVFQI